MSTYNARPADVVIYYNRAVMRWGDGPTDFEVSPPHPSVSVDGEVVAENLTTAQTRAVEAWMQNPTWSDEGAVATLRAVIASAAREEAPPPAGAEGGAS